MNDFLSSASVSTPKQEEGWDIVLGNPPYGASLTKEEKSSYKALYPNASSNTAQIFICRAIALISDKGVNNFIVPKSLAYVSTWQKIRAALLENLIVLIDCSKAFEHANLEMCIYLQNVAKKYKTYGTASFRERKALTLIDKAFTLLFRIFPLGVKEKELRLGSKIARNMEQSLADCGEQGRGDMFQSKVKSQKSDFKVLGGKEIQRYSLKTTLKGYVSKDLILSDKAEIKPNSVLLQRIISCAAMGVEQTSICGTIIEDNPAQYRIVDTIYQIVCHPHISNRLILGILHSKLLNWYAYNFVFGRAKLSFQFSGESVERIPIPKITESNQHIADKIIVLVDEILALNSCHHKGFIPKNLTNTQSQDSKNKDSFSLSQKEKGFIPSTLPLAPKRIKPPLFLFGNQGESLTISASSSKSAEALLPPLIRFYAPRNGRDIESLQSQIDSLVYQLYGLSQEEIRIIEGGVQ